MPNIKLSGAALLVLCALGSPPTAKGEAIPYFARKFNVACSTCHLSVPKLNATGEDFRLGYYHIPEEVGVRRTVPVAIWVSGRSEFMPAAEAERIRGFVNRVELISGGSLGVDWLSYFVEWRTVSMEGTGGSLRDRSGRFEDLFVVATRDRLAVTAGQFRQIEQIDVSVRPGLSEPLSLAASLPGFGEGTARERSLRGFAPSARSPAVRLTWNEPIGGDWTWTTSAAVPFPGEFSLPITREARSHASNEFEPAPKGLVAESFVRKGLTSYGGHVYFRNGSRFLANTAVTAFGNGVHWTGVAGVDRVGDVFRNRWSLEALVVPSRLAAFGGRIENRSRDGRPLAFSPFVNLNFPGTRYTFRLTVEQRLQQGGNATFIEVATIF